MDLKSLDIKTIATLCAVVVGWGLAQLSGIAKELWIQRRARRSLLEELLELKSELARTALIYSRSLQVHALQGIDNSVPLPISNHIFTNFYKDAVLSLNRSQRLSYQLIHAHVEQINEGIDDLRDVARSVAEKIRVSGRESIGVRDGELWGQRIVAGLSNVLGALWHVQFHLSRPRKPELLDMSKVHQDYLKYLQSVGVKQS